MKKTSLKNVLGKDAFWQVNKKIAFATSLDAAVILAELVNKESYFSNSLIYHKDYPDTPFFYATAENIKEQTTIGYKPQKAAIQLLESFGFIITKLMGVPAKIHFSICDDAIIEFLVNEQNKYCPNGKTVIAKTVKQETPKSQNITIGIEKNNKEKKERKEAPTSNDLKIMMLAVELRDLYIKTTGRDCSATSVVENWIYEAPEYSNYLDLIFNAYKHHIEKQSEPRFIVGLEKFLKEGYYISFSEKKQKVYSQQPQLLTQRYDLR